MSEMSTRIRNGVGGLFLGVLGNALWSAIGSGALISAFVTGFAYINGHPILLDRGITALITCVFIALLTVVLRSVSKRTSVKATQPQSDPKTIPQPSAPPLPIWISPDDRKHLCTTLKNARDLSLLAKAGDYKVRILHGPTDTATRLAQELGAVFTEAGWPQIAPPTLRSNESPPPKGIWVMGSLTPPVLLATVHLSNALNEIGIKHQRHQSAEYRKYDYSWMFIEE
jgi:hypothetical protein